MHTTDLSIVCSYIARTISACEVDEVLGDGTARAIDEAIMILDLDTQHGRIVDVARVVFDELDMFES
jgi:hypothetical protein